MRWGELSVVVSRLPTRRRRGFQVIVEDGFDRTVAEATDLQGAQTRRLQARGADQFDQSDDTQTAAEALFGMRLFLQNQLAEHLCGGADVARLARDFAQRPVGVTLVA